MLLVVYEYISVFSVWQDPYQHSTGHYKSMISSTLHLSSSLPYERATVGDYDPGVGRGHFGMRVPVLFFGSRACARGLVYARLDRSMFEDLFCALQKKMRVSGGAWGSMRVITSKCLQ